MINSTESLKATICIQYRFIKSAADALGFKGPKEYQRFRNTVLGSSKDLQVIQAIIKKFPNVDTQAIWGVDKNLLKAKKK